MNKSLPLLNEKVTKCELCPRLVKYRESVEPRKAFRDQTYWKKPVPGFGDPKAQLLIIGLAPSAHGGNRTGRIFTGDLSGDFLFKALYQEGFANQALSRDKNDGLELMNAYITAAVKCAPPNNKPTALEKRTCFQYLTQEMRLLSNVKAILTLGRFAFEAYLDFLKSVGQNVKGLTFEHGKKYHFENAPFLFCAYHPSPQNTNTGKLTMQQFCAVLRGLNAFLRK
ncbi:MAG: uracil-DNA glycosylase [Chlamydiae bacterium CG10_big_fil_rev_8_21_14_0_10_35_9]|nr:MAG: uracil-DNA glycosylase [Chlamydiae bacterium CG10_big_fil_rev_8_21_14_0_10_35_9]